MSERMDETRLKLWIGFWKLFLGTFVIGVVTAIINYQIQSREVDLKDREIILKDKQAEFREMERYAIIEKFKNHITFYALVSGIGGAICFWNVSLSIQLILILNIL